jgi:hypothetical protein
MEALDRGNGAVWIAYVGERRPLGPGWEAARSSIRDFASSGVTGVNESSGLDVEI